MPGISIAEHTDGNYLLYGAVDYYQGEPSGSLFKVDDNGNRVIGFQSVHTDAPIAKAVVLASGKIVIYGPFHYLNGADAGKVALLNADGSPDPNFHVDPTLNIRSITAQSTGKILAVTDSKLLRLNADGSVDDTFASGNFSQGISTITVAPGDGFYMTNYANIYRYNADGQPDMTFSASGFSVLGSVALQQDGKPVFLTRTYSAGPPYVGTFTVTRLLTSGVKDPSFTPASISNTNGDISDLLTQVLVRKNGKIALSGSFDSFGSQPGNIVELNTDGSASRTLLTTWVTNPFNMIEDSHENIFATGFIYLDGQSGIKHIVKINPDAQVDLSFSPAVSAVAYNGGQYSLQGQPSGKVLLGDYYYSDGMKNMPGPLVRLLPTGEVDPSFVPTIVNIPSQNVSAVLVQDDNKIVVSGNNLFVYAPSPNFGRLNADGGFDDSFQVGTGFTSAGYGSSPRYIRSKNNKLYLAGFFDAYNGQKCQSFVVLNADGSLAVTPNSEVPATGYIQDLEVQSSGKALLLGAFSLPGGTQRKVIRLNIDGTLDTTFDLVVSGNADDIEVDAHDNIWLAGSAFGGTDILLRFLPDGQPDNTFDQGAGFAKTPGYTSNDDCIGFFVKSIANDRFVVGGNFMTYDGHAASGVVMMDSNGNFIPIEGGNLDPVSIAFDGWYTNHTLYIAGRLSKDHGQSIEAFTSIVLPLEDTPAPLTLEVKSTSAMNLSWPNHVKGADKIIVERSDADDQHYKIVDTIDAAAVSYQATDMEESTPYYFKIYGANEFYNSPTATAHDTTFIEDPALLPATDITTTSFTAHWTYATGTDSTLFELSTDDFKTLMPGYQGDVVKSGSLSVTGLDPGTSYEYRVKRFKNGRASGFTQAASVTVSTVLGAEQSASIEAEVYPNPATQGLFIKLSERETNATATFHSSQGEYLMTVPLTNGTVNEVELRALKPGVFILSISTDSGSRRFKLVKA